MQRLGSFILAAEEDEEQEDGHISSLSDFTDSELQAELLREGKREGVNKLQGSVSQAPSPCQQRQARSRSRNRGSNGHSRIAGLPFVPRPRLSMSQLDIVEEERGAQSFSVSSSAERSVQSQSASTSVERSPSMVMSGSSSSYASLCRRPRRPGRQNVYRPRHRLSPNHRHYTSRSPPRRRHHPQHALGVRHGHVRGRYRCEHEDRCRSHNHRSRNVEETRIPRLSRDQILELTLARINTYQLNSTTKHNFEELAEQLQRTKRAGGRVREYLDDACRGFMRYDPSRGGSSSQQFNHRIQLIDVKRLKFTHASICEDFKHGKHGGESYETLYHALERGKVGPQDIDALLVMNLLPYEGAPSYEVVSGNRRLCALKRHAESVQGVRATCVVWSPALEEVPSCILAKYLLAKTTTNGNKIRIRESRRSDSRPDTSRFRH